MRAHDLDAPNLDTVREPHGRSRLFLEDDPPTSVEHDASISVMPSDTKRTSRISAVFLFLFVGFGRYRRRACLAVLLW